MDVGIAEMVSFAEQGFRNLGAAVQHKLKQSRHNITY
jgi:hypothetical protein